MRSRLEGSRPRHGLVFEGGARVGHGAIDIGGVGIGHLAEQLAGGGVADFDLEMASPSSLQRACPGSVIPTSARVSPIMTTTVTQETRLNQRELVHSPIRSFLLISRIMKISTKRQQHAVDHLREQDHLHQREIRESG